MLISMPLFPAESIRALPVVLSIRTGIAILASFLHAFIWHFNYPITLGTMLAERINQTVRISLWNHNLYYPDKRLPKRVEATALREQASYQARTIGELYLAEAGRKDTYGSP
jgi:hypothetical protein